MTSVGLSLWSVEAWYDETTGVRLSVVAGDASFLGKHGTGGPTFDCSDCSLSRN